MTRYRVTHSTCYRYEAPVLHGQHRGRLRPRDTAHQRVFDFRIECAPAGARVVEACDYFGNHVASIDVLDRHDRFEVTTRFEVDTGGHRQLTLPGVPEVSVSWESCRAELARRLTDHDLQDYRYDSPLVRGSPALRDYVAPVFTSERPLLEAVADLNQRIHDEFTYDSTATEVGTPLPVVMRQRRGVCQDFAHVAVGCLRALGLAARYVSGYLETRPPPGRPRLVGADASHAWASVYVPGHGWVDFDPTNAVFPGDRHVTVAWGRDFSDVSPLTGVILGGGAHRVHVGVDVEPLGSSSGFPPDDR